MAHYRNNRAPMTSTITSTIGLDRDGRQTGYLRLPHSVHRSAYGYIPIPIASFKNGDGPRVLLMGGTHGDEYEGQVILSNLIRSLKPEQVTGQVILLPMANFPAADAGLRTSPLDEGNLNRAFPGDARGTPTAQIAYYIEHVLLPRVDYLFDLHSGGSSLLYEPTLLISVNDEDRHATIKRELIGKFGLPFVLLTNRDEYGGYSSAAALRQGICSATTELAGGGSVTKGLPARAGEGLLNVLRHLGIISGDARPVETTPRIFSHESHLFASERGLLEPLAEPGEDVVKGQPAALIHQPETPGRPPIELAFDVDGVILARRQGARVERGDCLYHLGIDEISM